MTPFVSSLSMVAAICLVVALQLLLFAIRLKSWAVDALLGVGSMLRKRNFLSPKIVPMGSAHAAMGE